uniref:Reverse transcriptase domain-containing protein n=1 Tax=Latimeria chalumnae TaxID=7897 RepID=H3ABM4_LATCH
KYATGGNKIKLPTKPLTIGSWHVRIPYEARKLKQLKYTMERYRWNKLSLVGIRLTGAREAIMEDWHKMWYMGKDNKNEKGVALLVHKNTMGSIIDCSPVSSKLITICLAVKQKKNIKIVQDDEIEAFNYELESLIKNTPKKDILVVQGSWNAKIGPDAYEDWKGTAGSFGWGSTNNRSLKLLGFATFYNLCLQIVYTCTSHHKEQHGFFQTERSITGIDYILIKKCFQSSINMAGTRTFPGVGVGSGHDLIAMTLKMKLKKHPRPANTRIRYDLEKLKDPNVTKDFNNQIGGKLVPFLLMDQDAETLSRNISEGLSETAAKIIRKARFRRQPWSTNDILDLCDQQRELKQERYRAINRKIKQEIKATKITWINEECITTEKSMKANNNKKSFEMVKKLMMKLSIIKDDHGKLLTRSKEVANRWNCEKLYNYELTVDPYIFTTLHQAEVQKEEYLPVLRDKLKTEKAASTDNITAQLLKHGRKRQLILLQNCNMIWQSGKWPADWTCSIVIPLPKKDNLRQYRNYCTISLISHLSKIFLHIILNRLKSQAEELLAKEQAGFKERSTVEQIFNLQLLCEKYLKYHKVLRHNFIDIKKVFDRPCGQLCERSTSVEGLLRSSESTVLVSGALGEWFRTKVGVQGCLLSPTLLNIFLEQMMSEALENFTGMIPTGGQNICNLQFAADINL